MDKLKNKAKATKRKTALPLAAADAVCIITGFDAFGLSKANPSELVVETFPDILKTTPDEDHKKTPGIGCRQSLSGDPGA
jgi:hypothetical protein